MLLNFLSTFLLQVHYARGSAFETSSLLLYGLKVGYFQEDIVYNCIEKNKMIIHEINKVKSFLLKQSNVKGYVSDLQAEYELSQPNSQSHSELHPHPHPQPLSDSQPHSQPQK